MREDVGGDFHVFWQAGRSFLSGAPLYSGYEPGARPFAYPPFAALVFTTFAFLPVRLAASLYSIFNLAAIGFAAALTWRIARRTEWDARLVTLVLAVLCSLRFFLDNFNLTQINALVLLLVLLGVDARLRGDEVRAAAFLVAAAAIKVTPAFFVVWLLFRGSRRTWGAVVACGLAVIVVPVLLRGLGKGALDWIDYYHAFLERYQHGEVGTGGTNQDLGALVYRMMRPPASADLGDYRLFTASPEVAAFVYKASTMTTLAVFLAHLTALRVRAMPFSIFEVSTAFLISHMLSPVTRTAHLVSLLFPFFALLAIRPTSWPRPARAVLVVAWTLMAVTGLSGRDLIGQRAYDAVGGYSVIVWTMLLLFAISVVMSLRKPDRAAVPS